MTKYSPNIEYHQHDLIEEQLYANGGQLIIAGESTDGPYYEPIYIPNIEVAKYYFKNGSIVKKYQDVLLYNPSLEVQMMRIYPNTFEEAYEYLKVYDFDLLLLDNFKFGESEEHINAFIEFAKDKESNGKIIHGIVDLMPFNHINDLKHVFDVMKHLSFQTDMYEEQYGKYFSVVVDQLKDVDASAIYASMLATLDVDLSPNNKPIPAELKREFTKKELIDLRNNGIVAFRNSIARGVVCASSTTAVQSKNNPYKQVENFRIVQRIVHEIKDAVGKYVGSVGISLYAEKIANIISGSLREYQQLEIIRDFDFDIDIDELKGSITIMLTLVPIFTLEKITAHAQVYLKK